MTSRCRGLELQQSAIRICNRVSKGHIPECRLFESFAQSEVNIHAGVRPRERHCHPRDTVVCICAFRNTELAGRCLLIRNLLICILCMTGERESCLHFIFIYDWMAIREVELAKCDLRPLCLVFCLRLATPFACRRTVELVLHAGTSKGAVCANLYPMSLHHSCWISNNRSSSRPSKETAMVMLDKTRYPFGPVMLEILCVVRTRLDLLAAK